ncbi:hypothetical protein pSALSNUABM04_190 [Salmonella phage pSal-SNUABM-04]|nr:hypothetical protein pSALSNUABM04_190 [Salmonella phage pSal-SNUABM-04]
MYNAAVSIVGWILTVLYIVFGAGWAVGIATASLFMIAWPMPLRFAKHVKAKYKGDKS